MSTALSDVPSQDLKAVGRDAFALPRSALDWATTFALVAMPLARWHGWTLAETILGLLAAAGVAARLGSLRPLGLRARVLDRAIFALWVLVFAGIARDAETDDSLRELERRSGDYNPQPMWRPP